MNEVDAKVLLAAQNYYNDAGEPPALIVVHPEIAKHMSRTRFVFPQIPKIDAFAFVPAEIPPSCGITTVDVEVKILDTSRMDHLEYVLSKDRIDCLSEGQVIEVLARKFEMKNNP